MVSLIIKAPLADSQTGSSIDDLLNHIFKCLSLVISELLVILDALNIELMLGFWLWGLKWTGQDSNTYILQFFGHLWMREVFVNNNTLDQHTVFHTSTNLGLNLDQLKVDVLGLEIGNSHDGIDGNVGHLVVTLVDDLAAQGGLGSTHQVLSIVRIDGECVSNGIKMLHSASSSHLKTISNSDGMDSFVNEELSLFKKSSAQNNDTGGSVTDLIVL